MDEATRRDRVTKLVSELIAATKKDALAWSCNSIFGAAFAERKGIVYSLDFPSKTSTDRTLCVDREKVWYGPELNELVGAVVAQDRRLHHPLPDLIRKTGLDEEAVERAIDRAMKTF